MAFSESYMSLPTQSSPASCLRINLSLMRIKPYYTGRSRRYPPQSGSRYSDGLMSSRCRYGNSAVFATDKSEMAVSESEYLRQTKVSQRDEIIG